MTHRPGVAVANLNPRVIDLKRVCWIYVVNHYALLHTKYGFRRFF